MTRMPFQGSQGRLRALEKLASKANMTQEERARYEEEWKVYNDYFNTLDFAEQKGVQKGLQKGLQKGKEETARNLKELGVADDIIIKSTGLSKEEIEKIIISFILSERKVWSKVKNSL